MKKVLNLILAYIPVTFFLGYVGAMTLRWLQLTLLYRTMDQYFVGIGTTFASVTLLALIMSFFFVKALSPMNKLAKRVKEGSEITDEDRELAGKTYKKIRIFTFLENAIGFIIGQVSVSVIDFIAGNYPFTPSRFAVIVVQAVCIGTIISLYEVYYFDLLFQPYRKMLKIHKINSYVSRKRYISTKILLATVVTLIFMGVNAFSSGYGIIIGDHIDKSSDLMGEYLRNGLACLIVNFIECLGLMVIICLEMKNRIQGITNVVGELEQSGDLSTRINISIADDIGLLTSSQNALMDKLSSIIIGLKNETESVTSAAQILNESSAKSLEALKVMKNSVVAIGSEDKKTNEIINLTYSDIESLRDSAQKVEQLVLNENLAMQRASASIEELSGNINSIAETTKKADEISEELRVTTEKGMKSINTAEEAISLIQESSQSVQMAVAMIKKISSETNLLAMNASIEAAHAGEFGQGFAVVADEVRNLASTTAQNLQIVSTNMSEMEEKITNGVNAMQDARNAFNMIDQGVVETAGIVRRIAESVEEQRKGTVETLSASQEVVQSISSIKELAVSQRQHTDNVYENTKNIVASSNSITQSLSITEDAANNLNSILSDVNNCVEENKSSVMKMKSHIDEFKTE